MFKHMLVLCISVGVMINTAAAEGGVTKVGNAGDMAAIDFKLRGLEIFERLIASGQTLVNGMDIRVLHKRLLTSEVYSTHETIRIKDEVLGVERLVDATNDSRSNSIKFNIRSYERAKPEVIDYTVVHEVSQMEGFKDRNLASTIALVKAAKSSPQLNEDAELPKAPVGFEVLGLNKPAFRSLYDAVEHCRSVYQPMMEKYRHVICEPILQKGMRSYFWTEIHNEQRFVGIAVSDYHSSSSSSGSDSGSFSGTSAFKFPLVQWVTSWVQSWASSYSYSRSETRREEKPIIVNVPVQFMMRQDQVELTYGYRVLAREPLERNAEPVKDIFDSQTQYVDYGSAAEALTACQDFVVNGLVRVGYDANCQIYPVGSLTAERYAYRVTGRQRYVRKGKSNE